MKKLILGITIGVVASQILFPSAQAALFSSCGEIDLFRQAYEKVRSAYVREAQPAQLIETAINGMLSALDRHSSYMSSEELAQNRPQAGVGLEVSSEFGLMKVVTPIEDAPAAQGGVRTGDYVTEVDGQSTRGIPLNKAVALLRGPDESNVTLTILRRGEAQPLHLNLRRARITVESVKFQRRDNIGYIRIASFNEMTQEKVKNAITALKAEIGPEAIRGYVLDLRNNPGGLLDQGLAVADEFLASGEIVSTRGRNRADNQTYRARAGDAADGKPIMVLINEGSAGAAEIVAGALQDNDRATIVGMKSFGNAGVRTVFPLSGTSGGALFLTTANYYVPSGRAMEPAGITPDIAVAQTAQMDVVLRSEADIPSPYATADTVLRPPAGTAYDDFQLSYALDHLSGR